MPQLSLLWAWLPTIMWPTPPTEMPSPVLSFAVLRSSRLPEPGAAETLDGDAAGLVGVGRVLHDHVAEREVADLDAGAAGLAGVVGLDAVVARAVDLDAARVEAHVVALDEGVLRVLEDDAGVAHAVGDVGDQLVAARVGDDDPGFALVEVVALDAVVVGPEVDDDAGVGRSEDRVADHRVAARALEQDGDVARAGDLVALDAVGRWRTRC